MGFKYEGVIRNKWVYPVGKCLAEGASFVGIEELEGGGRGGAKRGEMAQDCWIAGITKADWTDQSTQIRLAQLDNAREPRWE